MAQPFEGGAFLSRSKWRVVQVTLGFVVDVTNISRAGGDILEPLVFAAIVEANQALLRNDPEVVARFGDSGEAIPDELRRPISVNAVAESLRLPFETVRRKTRSLIDQGRCVATSSGVYVPRSAIEAPEHAQIQSARFARVMRLHDDLLRESFLWPDEVLARPLPENLKRTVNRALSGFMLRTSDRLVELVGSIVDGFVLVGLAAANLEEDGPCSAPGLARRLDMADETVRRRLGALQRLGYAYRTRSGWQYATPGGLNGRMVDLARESEADLHRLFGRLKALEQASDGARAEISRSAR